MVRMAKYKVFVTDTLWPDLEIERKILAEADAEIFLAAGGTPKEICMEGMDCDAVIVNQNPMTRENLAILEKCKILVRLGVGVNEVDVAAATDQGIIVCNVPDYCQSETADHTMALVLGISRKMHIKSDEKRRLGLIRRLERAAQLRQNIRDTGLRQHGAHGRGEGPGLWHESHRP